MQFLLLVSLSALAIGLLKFIQFRKKHIRSKTILGLFLFGILLSLPFVLIEHMAFNIKYYLVILAFIAIELLVVSIEHKWEYLHNLIHHNIKELRLLSFFIVSIGFTYSELAFYIMNSHESILQLMVHLPIKATFALFMHTVLTSSAALLTASESLVEHFFLFLLYYIRLVFISVSHFLYVFVSEHGMLIYFLVPLMLYNLHLLFKHKRYLDRKGEVLT
jgi:hypothetical protein